MPDLNLKQYTIVLLFCLAIVSGYRYGYENILGQMAVAILLAGATNSAIEYLRTKTWRISDSGLIIGVLFFKAVLGWWGDYYHILTIIAGSILLTKYTGHWKMIFAFLANLSILILGRALISGSSVIDQLYLIVSISSFFIFFMLTDPKTSPLLPDKFIVFGTLAAVGSFISVIFLPSALFVAGLLAADLFVPYLNYLSLQKMKYVSSA